MPFCFLLNCAAAAVLDRHLKINLEVDAGYQINEPRPHQNPVGGAQCVRKLL